jgi:hypothetical protein
MVEIIALLPPTASIAFSTPRSVAESSFFAHSALSVVAASCFRLPRNAFASDAAKAGALTKMRF